MNNRLLKLDLSRADEEKGIPATLSTETPVQRNGYSEVLVHTQNSVTIRDNRSSLPLLVGHDSSEPAIGKITDIQVRDGKLKGMIKFGKSQKARDIYQDIKNQIIEGISIGYNILTGERRGDTYFATNFEVYEASVVGVPADSTSGYFRSQTKETKQMETETKPVETVKAERQRTAEITEIGRRHGFEEEASQAIQNGDTVGFFSKRVLESQVTEPLATPFINEIGDKPKEFSILNAVRGLLDPSQRGYEFEVSQDQIRKYGQPKLSNSVLMPMERVLTAATAGASTIDTVVSDRIIDYIQQEAVYPKLGVTEFTNLEGHFLIPIGSGDVTTGFYNLDGSSNITESTPTLTNKQLNPRTLASLVQVSHRFVVQSNVDAENYLRRLMASSIANKIDYAIMDGQGSSNEPDGILNVAGISQVTYTTTPTWANILSTVEALPSNSVDLRNANWVINGANISDLASTVKVSGQSDFLMDLDRDTNTGRLGFMAGFPVYVDKNISSGEYLFGDFSKSALGYFGPMEIAVDQNYDFQKGNVAIRALADFDFTVLQDEGFCRLAT